MIGVTAHAADGVHELVLGDERQEARHSLSVSGRVARETLRTEMGSILRTDIVRTLHGRDASLRFELAVGASSSTSRKPVLLEIQEIHSRRPQAFGYTVLAGSREIYFRSYYEEGSGPNHFFVEVPAECVSADGVVQVAIKNAGGTPFSIARVWAYSDFDTLTMDENTFRKMEILFGLSTQFEPPTDDARKAEWERNLRTPEFLREQADIYSMKYSSFECYGPPGLLNLWQYGGDIRGNVRDGIGFSAATGLRLQTVLSGFAWASAPGGPDGLGGSLSDIAYQPVAFDPETKKYRCVFGNPTIYNDRILAVQKRRFSRAAGFMVDRIAFERARGRLVPTPILVREHGVEYAVDGYFNPASIEAARRDGVDLDPEDGLSLEEKRWLNRNLTRYMKELADNTTASVGREAVIVDRGSVRLPEEQLFDSTFSHPDCGPVAPEFDEQWPHWWCGVADGIFASGETGVGASSYQPSCYDYIRGLGRLGCVNQECCVISNLDFLENHYQQGFQFETFFGGKPEYHNWMSKIDGVDGRPARPPIQWERRILDVHTRRSRDLGPADRIVEVDNLRSVGVLGGRTEYDRISTDDISRPGLITYRLDAIDGPFDAPLALSMELLTTPHTTLEIQVGPRADSLETVAKVPNRMLTRPKGEFWRPENTYETTVDLGSGMVGKTEYFLKIVLPPKTNRDHDLIKRVLVTQPWPRAAGHLSGNPFTVRQMRTMNLWVQDRAVAARMLEKYRSLGGEDDLWRRAKAAFDAGRPRTAHGMLVGEISQLLPARYAVRGHGRLGRWPVEVRLPADDDVAIVELRKVDRDGCEVVLTTEADMTCRIAVGDWPAGARHEVTSLGRNHYLLEPGVARDGKSSASSELAIVTAEERPKLPRQFSTTFARGAKGGIFVALQDPVLALDGDTFIPTAEKCKISRHVEHGPGSTLERSDGWAQELDRVDLVLDDEGRISEIKAIHGLERGTIRKFHPPVLQNTATGKFPDNGVIELENGHRYELGFGWAYKFQGFPGVGQYERDFDKLSEAFAPGTEVEISYCPFASPGRLHRAIVVRRVGP